MPQQSPVVEPQRSSHATWATADEVTERPVLAVPLDRFAGVTVRSGNSSPQTVTPASGLDLPASHSTLPQPSCGVFAAATSSAYRMAETLLWGSSTPETLCVQGVAHNRVHLANVQRGDILCVHLPRFTKTANQLSIALAQRWRAGRLKRIPFDSTVRGSVNVTHMAVILGVDTAKGRLHMAEASGKRGVCQATFDFGQPDHPDSHVARGANFLVYRLADAEQASRMADVAGAWTSAGGAYDRCGAALAPWRRNSLGWAGQLSLCHLAARRGDQPLRDRLGQPHAMFCSQFVARVWGYVVVVPALQSAGLLGRGNEQARAKVKEVFSCSPNNVLPSSLHRELLNDPRVLTIGYFTDSVAAPTAS